MRRDMKKIGHSAGYVIYRRQDGKFYVEDKATGKPVNGDEKQIVLEDCGLINAKLEEYNG